MKTKDFIEWLKTQDPEAIVRVQATRYKPCVIYNMVLFTEWEEFDPDCHAGNYEDPTYLNLGLE